MILKVTEKPEFTLCLEDTFFFSKNHGGGGGGGGGKLPPPPAHFNTVLGLKSGQITKLQVLIDQLAICLRFVYDQICCGFKTHWS